MHLFSMMCVLFTCRGAFSGPPTDERLAHWSGCNAVFSHTGHGQETQTNPPLHPEAQKGLQSSFGALAKRQACHTCTMPCAIRSIACSTDLRLPGAPSAMLFFVGLPGQTFGGACHLGSFFRGHLGLSQTCKSSSCLKRGGGVEKIV